MRGKLIAISIIIAVMAAVFLIPTIGQWDKSDFYSPTDTLSLSNKLKADTLTDYSDGKITVTEDMVLDSTLFVTGILDVANKITADTLDDSGDDALYIAADSVYFVGNVGIGAVGSGHKQITIHSDGNVLILKEDVEGDDLFQTWYTANGIRRGYFGYAQGLSDLLSLENETGGYIDLIGIGVNISGVLDVANKITADTLDDSGDGVITIIDDVTIALTLGVTGVLTASNKLAVDTITTAADGQITFQDDVTFDSTVTITIDNIVKESVKADTLEDYGDGWITVKDDLILAGVDLWIVDASGADSARIYDDGDTTRFSSDNPIKIGPGSLVIGTDGVSTFSDSVQISDNLRLLLGGADHFYVDARTTNRTDELAAIELSLTPSVGGSEGIHIDVDLNSLPNTVPLHMDVIATSIVAGENTVGIEIDLITSSATGGTFSGLEVAKSGDGTITVEAVSALAGVIPINQHSGANIQADTTWILEDDGSTYIPIDSFLAASPTDTTLFNTDDEYVYFGHSTQFDEIDVTLTTGANTSIQPTFEFSIAGPGWSAFIPIDGTNGFKESGVIFWESSDLANWVTTTINSVGSKYWIRIKREKNNINTLPTEKVIHIVASTEYLWDDNGDLTVNSIDLADKVTADTLGSSGDNGIHVPAEYIDLTGTSPRFKAIGSANATLWLKDSEAGTDSGGLVMRTENGTSWIRAINDAEGAYPFSFIEMDHGTGVVDIPVKLTVDTLDDSGDGAIYIADDVAIFSKLGLGTVAVPHADTGFAMLALEGENTSSAGPHVQFTTASDEFPLLSIYPYGHDNILFMFDGYRQGGDYYSSDGGSSFLLWKTGDKLLFQHEVKTAGVAFTAFDDLLSLSLAENAFNEDGLDMDFRIEASGVDSAFFVQGSDGAIYMEALSDAAGTPVDYNTATGLITYDSSTERHKMNIKAWAEDPRRLLNVPVSQYNRKSNGQFEIGIIAEDLEAAGFGEGILNYDGGNLPISIRRGGFQSALLGLIQSQEKEIQGLKKDLLELKDIVNN